jgi:hypothetical protein
VIGQLRFLGALATLTVFIASCADDAVEDKGRGGSDDGGGVEAGAPAGNGASGGSDQGETHPYGSGGLAAPSGGVPGSGGGDTPGNTAGESAGGTGGAGGGAGGDRATSTLVSLPNAEFTPGEPPATTNAGELPSISGLKGATATTNGGTTTLRIELDGMPMPPTFVVVIDGDDGYFIATATDANGDGVYEIEIQVGANLDLSKLVVHVAPIDAEGNVGVYQSVEYEIVRSGVGEVKVTLTFDQDADLDLHVVEPSGFEISFDLSSSPTEGKLDLDSNASCKIDGKNTENVFWPVGAAPDGSYSVFVRYFNDCGVTEEVNYTVTLHNGPGIETFRGTFGSDAVGEKRLISRFVH